MDLGISEKVAPLLARVRSFINEQVMPVEHEFVAEIEVDDPFVLTDRQMEILSSLKSQAREAGLWNFFLTGEEGSGLNTPRRKKRFAQRLVHARASSPIGFRRVTTAGRRGTRRRWTMKPSASRSPTPISPGKRSRMRRSFPVPTVEAKPNSS